MASDGSNGPRPYRQRQARTIFVRVPAQDWPAVKHGHKTEFRAKPGGVSKLHSVQTPTLVVAYKQGRGDEGWDSQLMLLEELWSEPLLSISPESLKREGFETIKDFRRYWVLRTKQKFKPLQKVVCHRIRPLTLGDREAMGAKLLETLYGDWL